MGIFSPAKNLKILFATTEESPFAKVGGLGEVMFSLPRALTRLGHDARAMLPRYGTIDISAHKLSLIHEDLEVPTTPDGDGKRLRCNVREYKSTGESGGPVHTYFLENQEYYELRSNVYGYMDDQIRFLLLSRGCLEFFNLYRDWTPDVIVSTDWMTGYVPNLLATTYKDYVRLQNIAAVFSIHNLASHGTGPNHRFIPEMEKDDGHEPLPDFFSPRLKNIDALRRGIMYADAINTVSPTYVKEILTEEFGEGLDALLRERRERLFGILNGIDYETNDPAKDAFLAKNFSPHNIGPREDNKLALEKRFGLPEGKENFLIGIVSRLTRQKGFNLLEPIIEQFLKYTKAQFVIVGTGDAALMDFFHALETKFPKQVRAHLQFDDTVPHLIFAGADVVIIPSLFEPSGLIQMEAMRFGAVPVAKKVGGLADTVEDYDPAKDTGTGFLFDEHDPTSLLIALVRSYVNWRHQNDWRQLQKRVMEQDFSWDRSAREYVNLLDAAVKFHREKSEKTATANQ